MPSSDPNVLLVVADQHRGDWLGADAPVRTPTIDRLAERGVRCSNAITPSPLCAPARACLAAGVEYPRSPVTDCATDFPTDHPTMYGRLRDQAGYHTATCGKLDLHKNTFDWGEDGSSHLEAWGFSTGLDVAGQIDAALAYVMDHHPDHPDAASDWDAQLKRKLDDGLEQEPPKDPYAAYLRERGLLDPFVSKFLEHDGGYVTPLPAHAFQDEWIGRRAMDQLRELPAERPWLFQINFGGPHSPFDVTREMHGWYNDPPVDVPLPDDLDTDHSPDEHREIRRNYAAKIELIDRWLGQYLATLDDRGELSDTIVIYTSDHGEMLGERGQFGKKSYYQQSVGIPLVAAGPGIDSVEVCETPVSLLDLHPTICDWAGLSVESEGESLRSLCDQSSDGESLDDRIVCSALDDWQLAFDGRFKLVQRLDDSETPVEQTVYEVDNGRDSGPLETAPERVERLGERLRAYRTGP